MVNCENRKPGEAEPCNKCNSCISIQNGSAVDLIEIDAASNRGIDDIRSLKEKVRLMPASLKYKVYIIDEVHMLTTEAFNALLKTLEEPPGHTLFILATTNPEKLPATIISRCLKFNFRKVTQTELVENLTRVAKEEGIKVESGVFKEIAKRAEGSFRDGQKIFEQISVGRKEITLNEVKTFLGHNEAQSAYGLLESIADKNLEGSIVEIERLATVGADFNYILEILLENLRQILLSKLGVIKLEDEMLAAQIPKLSVGDIKNLIQLLLEAEANMKLTPIIQLPLEIAVVEWGVEEIGETNNSNGSNKADELVKLEEKNSQEVKKEKTEIKNEPVAEIINSDNLTGEIREIDEMTWKKILATVKPLNHSIEALLRGARPLKMQGKTLTLEVFYKFHKEQLEDNKRRAIVEGACQEIIGEKGIKLQCVLGEKNNKIDSETKKDDIIDVAQSIFGK